MKNIAIFFGGVSPEHDISIITALQTIENLDKSKYKIFPIYISHSGFWFYDKNLTKIEDFINFDEKHFEKSKVFISAGENVLFARKNKKIKEVCRIDCALISLHGPNGEDGTIQGLLRLANIPQTSCDVLGSAVCMDKIIMKMIFEANNFPITKYVWFNYCDFENDKAQILKKIKTNLKFPLVIKPANLGSSIGISRAENIEKLVEAIVVAGHYDNRICVEEAVNDLREINCACFGNEENVDISELEEPISWEKFLSFDEKYLHFSGMKFEKNNKINIDEHTKSKIKKMAKSAFKILCCKGIVRIDFLFDNTTYDIYINEVNTIPGSFSNYLWENKNFKTLLDDLIENAINSFENKKKLTTIYNSDALKSFLKKGTTMKMKK